VVDELPRFTPWPGDCGLPELFTQASVTTTCDHHYRLHALGPTGLRATGKPVCPSQLLAPRPEPEDGGAAPDDPDGSNSDPSTGEAPPDAGGPPPKGSAVQVHEQSGDLTGGCAVARSAPPAGALLPLVLLIVFRRRRPE